MFVSSILHTYIYGKNKLVVLCLFKTLGKYCDKFLNFLNVKDACSKTPFPVPSEDPADYTPIKEYQELHEILQFLQKFSGN